MDNLGSNWRGAHLCIRGEEHIGCSGVILGNELIVDTVHLIALPHLLVLQSAQFINIFAFPAFMGLMLMMLALVILRDIFLLNWERIVVHKGYFDVIGSRYSSRS